MNGMCFCINKYPFIRLCSYFSRKARNSYQTHEAFALNTFTKIKKKLLCQGRCHSCCDKGQIKVISWSTWSEQYEPPHNKINKMTCAPSEDSDQPGHPQVWSESSLSPWRHTGPLTIYWAHSEDSDAQADLSLCWAHIILFVLSCGGSYIYQTWTLYLLQIEMNQNARVKAKVNFDRQTNERMDEQKKGKKVCHLYHAMQEQQNQLSSFLEWFPALYSPLLLTQSRRDQANHFELSVHFSPFITLLVITVLVITRPGLGSQMVIFL